MFIDHSKIYVKAGDGGNGCLSFHTEKYITNGGPDGGDGGDGGNVVLQAAPNLTSLQNFRFKHKFVAQNGAKGMSKKMYGKRGEDLIIAVPVGTVVKDFESGEIIADLTEAGQKIVVARGGKGGLGNMHYANSVRQAPQFATPGSAGEERELSIELKLIADVGLVGFPNAGKSTLLSVLTRAKPKIADYPFTTLEPVLGVVSKDDFSYVIADIPGIIENAHEGAGLGHDFLRHIERTRLLVHVVDLSGTDGRDPLDDFKTINNELEEFSIELAARPQIVVGNKCDGVTDEEAQEFVDSVKALGYEDVFIISAAGQIGIRELADKITETVSKLPPTILHDIASGEEKVYTFDEGKKYEIIINEDGNFEVTGKWINKIFNSTNFGDTESTNFFQRTLENEGVFEELKKMGVKEGDTVKVCDLEFDYYD
ncbi:GTP-binding protein [Ruminococcaceae bacterium R-25]|nr:GTP-binding protein [Ruminococcaceae bacterium R-25]SUQ10797.1 GTP-binding protein [Oscillospiraceae bacterium]